MNVVPMDYQYHYEKYGLTRIEYEIVDKCYSKIYQKTAPAKCFSNEKERETYFCRVHHIEDKNIHKFLSYWAYLLLNKKQCFICGRSLIKYIPSRDGSLIEELDYIIEHEHDNSKVHSDKRIVPGRFRAITCRSCNCREREARKLTSNRGKKLYWKRKFSDDGYSNIYCEYLISKLEEYSYFNDYFKHHRKLMY